jgi:GDP-fucose transporter C1
MIFLNKYLLNSNELKFDAPMFVTWYQCLFSIFVYLIWYLASKIFPKRVNFFPFAINFQTCIQVILISKIY